MIALLLSVAFAAPADRYPWRATVDLTTCTRCTPASAQAGSGAWRVPIPPELRGSNDPADGTDMVLLGPDGEPVPVAWVRGPGEPERASLRVRRTDDPDVFTTKWVDRPIDGLTVELDDGVASVRVEEEVAGVWQPLGEPVLVWRGDQIGEQERVPLAPTSGPLRISLDFHDARLHHAPDIEGYRRVVPGADPSELTLSVADSRLEERGLARYTVLLPHALPVERVLLDAEDPLFEREAFVVGAPLLDGDLGIRPTQTIRRVHIGGAQVEQIGVTPDGELTSDQLVIYVSSAGRPPLHIPEVTVQLAGRELLLLDPGPGPFTLLAGAPEGTSDTTDLQVALPELARLARSTVEPAQVGPNPDYVPPEVRGGLTDASTVPDVSGQRWSRDLSGATGLARVPLDQAVLAGARADLGDLRVVDAEGHQLPYLLQRLAVDHQWPELPIERTEDGHVSRLRVRLPDGSVPVSTVSLHTDAPLFERQVTLSRVAGAHLDPLRTFQWSGGDRPLSVSLDVDQRVGEELVVSIDNGDNPPLPISSVTASWPAWELVASLPTLGARLLYGDASTSAPDYDLSLLRAPVLRRASTLATLGPAQALDAPRPGLIGRLAVLVGLGVLVLGLGWLTVGLVRGVKPSP